MKKVKLVTIIISCLYSALVFSLDLVERFTLINKTDLLISCDVKLVGLPVFNHPLFEPSNGEKLYAVTAQSNKSITLNNKIDASSVNCKVKKYKFNVSNTKIVNYGNLPYKFNVVKDDNNGNSSSMTVTFSSK